MTITIFYNTLSELKSQILVLTVFKEKYHITWHFFEQEGDEKSVHYQTNVLTDQEIHDLMQEMEPLFRQHGVPEFIRDTFEENVQNHSE